MPAGALGLSRYLGCKESLEPLDFWALWVFDMFSASSHFMAPTLSRGFMDGLQELKL